MDNISTKNENFILNFLHGKYSLPISFWGYGIGFCVLSFVILFCIQILDYSPIYGLFTALYGVLIIIFEFCFAIGVWNSSTKYKGSKFWKYMARIYIIISIIAISFGAIGMISFGFEFL